MNELASQLQSSKNIHLLETVLNELFSKRKIVYGKELRDLIKKTFGGKLSEIVVEILIENEVIIKSKAGSNIDSYLFEFNTAVSKFFFKHQVLVAEILEKTYIPSNKQEPLFKVLATYPEDGRFKKDSEMSLLYPTIKRLIQESNNNLDIINPFFEINGTKKIIPDLVTVAKKGVKIRIVTRSFFDKFDGNNNRESIKLICDTFKKENLLDQLSIKDYFKRDESSSKQIFAIHSKILISDESCYLGSANITMNSLYSNLETGVVFQGEEVKKIKILFNTLWLASNPISINQMDL
ncbi:phospholipase D family protein [Candidatus Woesearchaeota archaeon]|nr:phospholipase D family protein [Candidatus Woesearchaeota archaeon]